MVLPFRIGADENGLGPRLGPLVVTAVLAKVTEDGHAVASRKPRGGLAERLGDSKAMIAHGDVALGEAWARAVGRRMGIDAATPDALVFALSADARGELTRRCPPHVEAQCWDAAGESFDAGEGVVAAIGRDLDRLADKGVDVVAARTTIVCTERLNASKHEGLSRFDVDLHAMERMIEALGARAGAPVDAVCGKVGGYARYGPAFGPLAGRLHAVVEEGPARSVYQFPGLGRVSFVRDADASDLLVSMASMIGKWVREALMSRIVRHWADATGQPFDASGYHDPVTDGFVQATALVRRERRVPDTCFERERDPGAASRPRPARR